MSNNQELVDRLFSLTHDGHLETREFAFIDSLVYGRLLETYGDDETFEASIVEQAPVAIPQAA